MIVGVVNPLLLIPSGVMLVVFYFLRRFYLRTARSVKRLEGIGKLSRVRCIVYVFNGLIF